jgi:hypothetical protein
LMWQVVVSLVVMMAGVAVCCIGPAACSSRC